MRRLLTFAILMAPLCASAEYLDVIQGKYKEKCSMQNEEMAPVCCVCKFCFFLLYSSFCLFTS